MYVDRHWVERSFEVGDLVYLRRQTYRQSSLKGTCKGKLKPRFYGPYCVIHRIGEVAYELELSEGSHIHNVFHVSCLKKAIRQNVIVTTDLSPLNEEWKLILEPVKILEVREKALRNNTLKEYLVRWRHLLLDDAMWEGEHILQHLALRLLEDKQILGQEDCNVPIIK